MPDGLIPMTARRARKVVEQWCNDKLLPYPTMKAETVDFTDLSRRKSVFVWVSFAYNLPEDMRTDLDAHAHHHDFHVMYT